MVTPIFLFLKVISMLWYNFLSARLSATLNFQNFKVALNPPDGIVLNFVKSCILVCWLFFKNKKWGVTVLVLKL